jgi:hypothetical protein
MQALELKENAAQKLPADLEALIEAYLSVSRQRPEILFRQFLPLGYAATTLSSVPAGLRGTAIFAKMHLGMLITLLDDFADHPRLRNPVLLGELYRLNLGSDAANAASLSREERGVLELARLLLRGLESCVRGLPFGLRLLPALRFDLERFYSANRFSELLHELPGVASLREAGELGPHNMGMVAAGTIDLMASPALELEEIGACREILLLGQRLGRISNLIFTKAREEAEGDPTNEILMSERTHGGAAHREKLEREFLEGLRRLREAPLVTFDSYVYAEGIAALHRLHAGLEGKI